MGVRTRGGVCCLLIAAVDAHSAVRLAVLLGWSWMIFTRSYKVHTCIGRQEYRHTFIIYNTYYFSTVAVVTRTRVIVPLYVHCLVA